VAEPYTVTVRPQGTPRKRRFDRLDDALAGLESEARALEQTADHQPVGGTFIRRIDPVKVVVARLELSGPWGLRGGVDVRGDGSSEAFTGRFRRRVIEQRAGESSYQALRRRLS
jgi:hypothetical protein